jgi:hypothetical protein
MDKISMQSSETDAVLTQRLNGETAKIEWHQLQKHYASGNVLLINQDYDLIKVAMAMHQDDTEQIKQWLEKSVVAEVSDSQAQSWYEKDIIVWALVIPPFVLVQEVISTNKPIN